MWACLVGFGRFLALCLPTRRAATAGAHFRACRGCWGPRVAPMCAHAANTLQNGQNIGTFAVPCEQCARV